MAVSFIQRRYTQNVLILRSMSIFHKENRQVSGTRLPVLGPKKSHSQTIGESHMSGGEAESLLF